MQKRERYRVAVLGATGAVGRAMVQTLERRNFPVEELRLFASPRSAGQTISFHNKEIPVQAVSDEGFEDIDIALFSAGGSTSLEWSPRAVQKGAVVIDNSSAYRMDPAVPLVVPEVNPQAIARHNGIIANPNCSTIQMVVALGALQKFGLVHVNVSTYQAVSGMGQKGIEGLHAEIENSDDITVFPLASQTQHYPMAHNVLPQCDVFLDNGYTKEEMKLVNESRKILEIPDLQVSPTAVRVPVVYGHSESVSVRFKQSVTPDEVRSELKNAPGVVLVDDPAQAKYPHPLMAVGTGETYIGRIRQDLSDNKAIMMFIVADNLLKGAAWNAVQIAEELISQ